MTTTTNHPTLFHPEVEVRVSKRRKKTAGAHWEGERIVVVVPTHLRGAEREDGEPANDDQAPRAGRAGAVE